MAIGDRQYKRDAAGRMEIAGVTIAGEVNVDLDILQGTLDDQLFLGNSVQSAIGVDASATATRLLTDSGGRLIINSITGQTGVAGGSGVLGATVQRVTIATNDTVATDLTAIKTAVEIVDDWDETNRAKVNPIVGQAGVAAGTGALGVTVQRVTVATDDSVATDLTAVKNAVEIMDDWDDGLDHAQVDIAVQTLTAVKVSATTAVNATGNRIWVTSNTDQIAGTAINVNGGAKDAGTQTVILATDCPAVTALEIMDDWDDGLDHCQVDLAVQTLTAVKISADAAANTLANPIFNQISQDGTNAVDATHPLPISKDLAANLVTNPIFNQISVDGTNAMGATHPLVVSKDTAANATGNRIWVKSDVDMIGGVAVNVNGGNRDAGTQTVTLADDDPAVASLGIMDDWDAVHDSAVGSDGPQVMLEARTSRGTAVANGDAVRATANEYGEAFIAGYVWASNSIRVGEVDPLDQKYVSSTLADVTNGADATFYYYSDMAGFSKASWGFVLDCDAVTVTATIEGTNLDDGTAPGSIAAAEWHDLTNEIAGVVSLVSAAAPASDLWIDNAGVSGLCKYIRIKIVAATGATTGDWKITEKKMY
jgi:hypothetical protein